MNSGNEELRVYKYVKLKEFCAHTGYTECAIRNKIHKRKWLRGKQYTVAPDGNILINLEEYDKWVESRKNTET